MTINFWKKLYIPLGLLFVFIASFLLMGCTGQSEVPIEETYTKTEVEGLLDAEAQAAQLTGYATGYEEGKGSVDTTVDNQQAIDEYLASLTTEGTESESQEEYAYSSWFFLGEYLDLELDDNEIETLFDGDIDFDGDDLDTKELLLFGSDTFIAYTGDNSYEEEFGAKPYIVAISRDDVAYIYLFEDDIAMEDIDEDTPLDITFLGKELSITGADSGELTFFTEPNSYLKVDESLTVEGKTLVLIDVGVDSVIVQVDGDTEIIEEGNTETVNDLKIYLDSTFMRDDKAESAAVLVLGKGSKQTVENGDFYNDEDLWEWVIENDGTNLISIGLQLDEKFNTFDSEVKALAESECLEFPEGYVSFCFSQTNEPDYQKIFFEFDEIDVDDVNIKVTKVELDDDLLELDGQNLDIIYTDGTAWYYQEDNEYILAGDTTAVLDLSDAEYSLDFGPGGEVYLTDELGDWITISADAENERLGDTENDAEGSDILYNGDDIGESEYDVLTAFGIQIIEPESETEQDEAILLVPEDRLEVEIGIS